jgi:hypothetical protein
VVFWVLTPYGILDEYRRFGGTCCHHLENWRNSGYFSATENLTWSHPGLNPEIGSPLHEQNAQLRIRPHERIFCLPFTNVKITDMRRNDTVTTWTNFPRPCAIHFLPQSPCERRWELRAVTFPSGHAQWFPLVAFPRVIFTPARGRQNRRSLRELDLKQLVPVGTYSTTRT